MSPARPSHLLTPAEACALAGVGPTTLKRWADGGVLAHVKTAGGHRRFLRAELERFLRTQTRLAMPGWSAGAERGAERWIATLVQGPSHAVEAELLFARSRLGSWHQVAGELGGVLTEMGERWRREELTILDEHIASERLARGLARVGEALPSRPGAPRALLACLAGEEHVLGLALAELCLRELGWSTLWAGSRTPVDELEPLAASLSIDLLALSASVHFADGAELGRACRTLEHAARERAIALALGGEGAWPEEPSHARRFREFDSFHRFAAELGRARA